MVAVPIFSPEVVEVELGISRIRAEMVRNKLLHLLLPHFPALEVELP